MEQKNKNAMEKTETNQGNQKAIIDIRLRQRFGAAPWWTSLSIHRCTKSLLPAIVSL